ncbi:MAG: T9SS type A sorting domain-containing protein [Bacteroidia bacterium]|nr:T9SS type A sorting domain-containing protein [Bacteroidia bacterium]MDW8347425.1 choice-of-anchor V domain-containing protein [Bacteroidia bacterium]
MNLSILTANSSGAPSGRAGAPAESGATCTGCHGGTNTFLSGLITSNIPVTGFVPGQTYTITATINRPGVTKYGFSISPQNNSGTLMGTLINTSSETQLVGMNKYITHTSSGTNAPSATKTWTFDWTAPTADSVVFYGAFLAANGNSTTSGDNTFTSQLKVYSQTYLSVQHQEWLDKSVFFYPNPVISNYINIRTDIDKITDIRLYDCNGRPLKTNASVQGNIAEVQLNGLQAGIYFVQVTLQSHGMVHKKVIKW